MANFRQIQVSLWKDEWFFGLSPEKKLLFVYLFSNELASLAGIYKIPLAIICFETGLEEDFVIETMNEFADADKAYYQDGILWVVNMRKYHETSSETVQARIRKDLRAIPECDLKTAYRHRIDTLSDTLSEDGDTVGIPSLKKRKEKKRKPQKRKEENTIGTGAAGLYICKLFGYDYDTLDSRTKKVIDKWVDMYGEYKVCDMAQCLGEEYDPKPTFREALKMMDEGLLEWEVGTFKPLREMDY